MPRNLVNDVNIGLGNALGHQVADGWLSQCYLSSLSQQAKELIKYILD